MCSQLRQCLGDDVGRLTRRNAQVVMLLSTTWNAQVAETYADLENKSKYHSSANHAVKRQYRQNFAVSDEGSVWWGLPPVHAGLVERCLLQPYTNQSPTALPHLLKTYPPRLPQ